MRGIYCPSERHIMDTKELIELLGFSLESQNKSGSFGDFVSTYNSPYFRLRIVGDRGQKRIDLAFNDQPREWFDLCLVRFSLGQEKDDLAQIPFEDGISFLEKNFTKIREIFFGANSSQMKARLQAMGTARAKKMFPGNFQK